MSDVIVVNAIIKNKEGNKFLILKRKASMKIHPDKWSFPGGKVRKNEDLFTALKREIKEETNLDIEERKERISAYTYRRPSGKQTKGMCFLVKSKKENITLNKEHDAFAWVTPEEFENYNHIDELEKEIKKAFKH